MNREELKQRVSHARDVEHEGITYHLRKPRWDTVNAVLAGHVSNEREPEYGEIMESMTRAVEGTLIMDDGALATHDDAMDVLADTGQGSSPVGRAALELCGMAFGEAEKADEVPFS